MNVIVVAISAEPETWMPRVSQGKKEPSMEIAPSVPKKSPWSFQSAETRSNILCPVLGAECEAIAG